MFLGAENSDVIIKICIDTTIACDPQQNSIAIRLQYQVI